jgi:hypothetical protein
LVHHLAGAGLGDTVFIGGAREAPPAKNVKEDLQGFQLNNDGYPMSILNEGYTQNLN